MIKLSKQKSIRKGKSCAASNFPWHVQRFYNVTSLKIINDITEILRKIDIDFMQKQKIRFPIQNLINVDLDELLFARSRNILDPDFEILT